MKISNMLYQILNFGAWIYFIFSLPKKIQIPNAYKL